LAVDDNGDVIASADPDGGRGAWSIENLIPFVERDENEFPVAPNGIFAVSCASTSLCVLGATEARIYSSTDPFLTPPPARSAKRGKRRGPTRPHAHIVAVDHARNFSGKGVLPVRFRFYAKGARGFRCRRDGGHWRHCHSPHRYLVGLGQHTFRVRAVGRTGLLGPVATKSFRIRKSGTCHPPQC